VDARVAAAVARGIAATKVETPTDSSVGSNISTLFQPFGDGTQYGASTKLYSVKVFGFPDCKKQDDANETVCIEHVAFTATIDANMIHALTSSASAAREYMVSRKGSPLSLSLPTRSWSSKKDNLRQTWVAAEGYGSLRWIPVDGDTGNANGAFSIGATVEMHSDFEVAEQVPGTTDVIYPGFVFLSFSPSLAWAYGDSLRTFAFGDIDKKYLYGFDIRGGFTFQGKQPISVSINATWTPDAFTVSKKSVGISFTKIFKP